MFYYNGNGLLGNDRVLMDNFTNIEFTFSTGLLKLTYVKYIFKRYIMPMYSARHFYTVS